jgi:hypothetical protein
MMELLLFFSTLIYRYDFKLVDDSVDELEVVEGFLRKVRLAFVSLARAAADPCTSSASRMHDGRQAALHKGLSLPMASHSVPNGLWCSRSSPRSSSSSSSFLIGYHTIRKMHVHSCTHSLSDLPANLEPFTLIEADKASGRSEGRASLTTVQTLPALNMLQSSDPTDDIIHLIHFHLAQQSRVTISAQESYELRMSGRSSERKGRLPDPRSEQCLRQVSTQTSHQSQVTHLQAVRRPSLVLLPQLRVPRFSTGSTNSRALAQHWLALLPLASSLRPQKTASRSKDEKNDMRRRKYSSISLLRGEASPAEVSGSLVLFVKRKAGSIVSLLVGVLVGLILAQALSGGGVRPHFAIL